VEHQQDPRRASRIVPGGTRVYHYLNNARILEYELDSPELRAAIAKSKFKDIERFGKLQKGTSCCRTTATRSGIATSRLSGSRRSRRVGGSASAAANAGAGRQTRPIEGCNMRKISASLVLALLGVAAVGTERRASGRAPCRGSARRRHHRRQAVHLLHLRAVPEEAVALPSPHRQGHDRHRGYPLDPHHGERSDHPHHVGLWFNYGDVNGLDFWNNSDAIPAARADKMGTIIHQRVIEAVSGKDKGELNVEMDWVDVKGTVLLKENTRYIFQGDDRTASSTASRGSPR
jgi:hypothetical protein